MGARGSIFPSSLGPTDPVLSGVITAWLRVPLATVTGLGMSSLPDVLNSNPAVQATDALRPPRGTSANGLSIASPSSDVMSWPLTAANNATSQWGIATHVRSPLGGAARTLWSVRALNGADLERCTINITAAEALLFQVNIDDLNNRRGTSPINLIGDNTWQFVTVEFDGTQASEAGKMTITVDGVVQTLTFTNGTGVGSLPSAMVAAVGSGLLFANNTAGTSAPYAGDVGPNIYFLANKQVGATEGLLTPAARFSLGAFERPT